VPTSLEAEIQILLKSSADSRQVADELVRRWQYGLFNPSEQSDCALYLIASKNLSKLFRQVHYLIENDLPVPWLPFAEAIIQSGLVLNSTEANALIEGARSQNSLADLALSQSLQAQIPELELASKELKLQKQNNQNRQRQIIRDKIVFLRANRMYDDEARVVAQANALFPGDTEFALAAENLKLRKAHDTLQDGVLRISRSAAAIDSTQELIQKFSHLNSDQQSAKTEILRQAQEILELKPEAAYDLAIALHFMDFNLEGADLLEKMSQPSAATEWLKLELLLQARQFIRALDVATRLDSKYADDPETDFSTTYARARALRGLGQNSAATELLRSLTRIRPEYKSAQSLLVEWTRQDNGDA
jgi:hypothetical protein